jgi:hypothetical protein
LPGPANNPQCSIEMVPDSQGIRTLNSASCAMQLHNLMLTTGRLVLNGRLDSGVSTDKDGDWFDASMKKGSLVADLEGRADDVARVETSARAATQVKSTYWTTVQKTPKTKTGQVF